ncbi:DUF3422 family protein [Hwanghaeella sp.]|uniref:DUF3422 family protein n=1 Tax=Hwanghaeella sp. TaxID=2605943 RepID=UPI003CCBAF1F
MFAIGDNAKRYELVNELHARPFQPCEGPMQVTHYAFQHADGDGDGLRAREHAADLCRRFGATPPPDDASHHTADLGNLRVKWELHTEFSSYTFFSKAPFKQPFAEAPGTKLPRDWLEAISGTLVVALNIAYVETETPTRSEGEIERLFYPEGLVVSQIARGAGQVWTDFRLHEDGHARILVHNRNMSAHQAGRLIQRLIEIGTYYLFSLIALPIAREVSGRLKTIDGSLAHLTLGMGQLADHNGESLGVEHEADLLRRLTRLSTDIEALSTMTAFRFGAADAYYALVKARVRELREDRVEGYQTIDEFLERRLAPAMRTCESVAARISDLSRRATRTANLMRTRVDVTIQAQNQDLLSSMNRRARLQLRLQETVEGLSVAAISYYAVGLIAYLVKGLPTLGVEVSTTVVTAVATPVVVGAVWYGLHRYRMKLEKTQHSD